MSCKALLHYLVNATDGSNLHQLYTKICIIYMLRIFLSLAGGHV